MLIETPKDILNFLIQPTISGPLLVFKIVFLAITFFFLGFIIYMLFSTTWLKRIIIWDLQEVLTYKPHGLIKISKQWVKITERLKSEIESEAKLAVMEADSMLNDVLKRLGYDGETLGERLEKLTDATLPNIKEVWEAHKIRNNIVHDPDYRLSLDEAKRVVAIYEKALTDLHTL